MTKIVASMLVGLATVGGLVLLGRCVFAPDSDKQLWFLVLAPAVSFLMGGLSFCVYVTGRLEIMSPEEREKFFGEFREGS